MSCDSHGAYSSAVRLESVEARHWARHALPSWTANRVLVLPTSMARSMGSGRVGEKTSPAAMRRRTGRRFKFEFAARRQAPRTGPSIGSAPCITRAVWPEAVRAREPGLAQRLEALASSDAWPSASRRMRKRGEELERLGRARVGRNCVAQADGGLIDRFGRGGEVHAERQRGPRAGAARKRADCRAGCRRPCAPPISTSLGHLSVARAARPTLSSVSAMASAVAKPSSAISCGGRDRGEEVGRQQVAVERDPRPAAPSAAGGLAPRDQPDGPDFAAFGAAARLQDGGVDFVERLDRRPRRRSSHQLSSEPHPHGGFGPVARARQAPTPGWGRSAQRPRSPSP